METKTFDNGSRVYIDNEAIIYPSVTTIRSMTSPKGERDRLRRWQHKLDKVHGSGAAVKERDLRASEGKQAHKDIEDYFNGHGDFPDSEYTRSAGNLLRFFRSKVIASELPVHYPHPNGYAGTLDLLIPFEDKLTVFDFVTSRRPKREEWLENKFLQAAAYSLAYGFSSGEYPSQVGAIVLSPSNFQIFTKPISKFEPMWWSRVHRFYEEEMWRELGLDLG